MKILVYRTNSIRSSLSKDVVKTLNVIIASKDKQENQRITGSLKQIKKWQYLMARMSPNTSPMNTGKSKNDYEGRETYYPELCF